MTCMLTLIAPHFMRQRFGVKLIDFSILLRISYRVFTFKLVFHLAGHVDAAKVLIEHAANVSAKDKFHLTPLHFGSSNGNYIKVQKDLPHRLKLTSFKKWNL